MITFIKYGIYVNSSNLLNFCLNFQYKTYQKI